MIALGSLTMRLTILRRDLVVAEDELRRARRGGDDAPGRAEALADHIQALRRRCRRADRMLAARELGEGWNRLNELLGGGA
jgi:hypothetical protein